MHLFFDNLRIYFVQITKAFYSICIHYIFQNSYVQEYEYLSCHKNTEIHTY